MRRENDAQHNWTSSAHEAAKLQSLRRLIGEQYEHGEGVETWSAVPIPQCYEELSLIQGHMYVASRVGRSNGVTEEARVTGDKVKKFVLDLPTGSLLQ